jgi:hypothetical protein
MKNNVLLVLAGLLVGCTGASVIRSASAHEYPPNASAPRWEQFCHVVGARDDKALNVWLSSVGREGWELVGMSPVTTGSSFAGHGTTGLGGGIACFERPAGAAVVAAP